VEELKDDELRRPVRTATFELLHFRFGEARG